MRWETLQGIRSSTGQQYLTYNITARADNPEYLVFASLAEESLANAYQYDYDLGKIIIAATDQDKMIIAWDYMTRGHLFWRGRIPLSSPMIIYGTFVTGTNGYRYKMMLQFEGG